MISRTRRAAAALAVVAVASTAAGCGIAPTGVRDGGEPAVGFRPSVRLYFVSGARLRAVTRPIPSLTLKETLDLLLDGPSADERERGLRTDLITGVHGPLKLSAGRARVLITLPPPQPTPTRAPELFPTDDTRPDLSKGQLTCTAAGAVAARENIDPDAVTVVFRQGEGGRTESFHCSEFPRG
ncbi:hypothetical protein [Microtetraspora niveoalba]|uniref:hypothetical protein n=1 Tax=Microtetraspora niveoalba TaxID=46175 RepID=UPI000834F812|nr:hypothetical protein [Microtetraspora niveoalba]